MKPITKDSWKVHDFYILLGSLLFFLLFFSLLLNIPLSHFLKEFSFGYYHPNANECYLRPVAAINPNFFVFLFILFSSFVLSAFGKFARVDLKEALTKSGFFALAVVMFLQMIGHGRLLKTELRFCDMYRTVDSKYTALFGELYDYSKFSKATLPGWHHAKLISVLDFNLDDDYFWGVVLGYFLYPIHFQPFYRQPNSQTDFWVEHPAPIDAILIFKKDTPEKFVPSGFKIIGKFNEDSLIGLREKIN